MQPRINDAMFLCNKKGGGLVEKNFASARGARAGAVLVPRTELRGFCRIQLEKVPIIEVTGPGTPLPIHNFTPTGGHVLWLSGLPAGQHASNNEVIEGEKRMEPRRKAKRNLEQLYVRLLNDESKALKEAVNSASENFQDAFEIFRVKADSIKTVKGCLTELEAELNNIEEIVATEECFQRTGYKGIADWANDAWNANQNFINTMVAICMLGVGITYSSIYSATRGDIGYMCWSFSLFMSGLALSTMTQLVLLWTTQLPDYAMPALSVCQILLGVPLYGALRYTAHPPTDARLVFTTAPRPPAYLALSARFLLICYGCVQFGGGGRFSVVRQPGRRKSLLAEGSFKAEKKSPRLSDVRAMEASAIDSHAALRPRLSSAVDFGRHIITRANVLK
ncbi:hypothetical protein BS47DRAFT_1362877 [Hydnum rufescens UP504]|uniref:Uncharacterized protein n=1 Tax=Hydnum rufescens UP504 TaxID=1448309 RepID=A0A9P6DT46_9AGAM|nr:hypothetical protein BS47DRAFT_1362877 [Hydnum rufescens UP504]